MRYMIESIIRDEVSCDIHFDLCDTERAADAIASLVLVRITAALEAEARSAVGAYGDGLYEAIEVLRRELAS